MMHENSEVQLRGVFDLVVRRKRQACLPRMRWVYEESNHDCDHSLSMIVDTSIKRASQAHMYRKRSISQRRRRLRLYCRRLPGHSPQPRQGRATNGLATYSLFTSVGV
jgi:hypothetical protein